LIRQRHRKTAAAYLASDLLATLAAFFIAWYLRFVLQVVPGAEAHIPDMRRYLELLPFVLVLWPVVFHFHGLYQIRRSRGRVDELVTVLVAILLAAVLLSGLFTWYRPTGTIRPDGSTEYFTYSRAFLALFALIDLVTVAVGRIGMRMMLQSARIGGYSTQRILVVGAGALGKEITRKLVAHHELGFEVVGFLDDEESKASQRFSDVPVIGALDSLQEVLAERKIDQVYVALPLEAHRKMMEVLRTAGRECVEVKMVPDILQYATLRATLEDLDGTPVINLTQTPLQGWNSLVKRMTDLAVASAASLVLLPLLPIIALAVWIEDHGPIFYRQERMGLDGRPFQILKFRSMRVGAEVTTGPIWAVRDDPRRTVVGSFLRRWSLDELPQLWNVLRGDMSIVGPRPERPAFVREFKHKIPSYMLRHRVKAGITGWAQVHGWRGNTSIRKRIQYDLYYIENWSLKLDFKILWMTLRYGLWANPY